MVGKFDPPFFPPCQGGKRRGVFKIQKEETRGIPDLVAKVPSHLTTILPEPEGLPLGLECGEGEAKSIGSIFLHEENGVYARPERFRHTPPFGIEDRGMDVDIWKRDLLHKLETGEDHSGDPEVDDPGGGEEDLGWIEALKILCPLRPTEGGKGPESRGEPGIEDILFLDDLLSFAFWTSHWFFLGDDGFGIGEEIISNSLVSKRFRSDGSSLVTR